jgi:ubiquinone/menaquinone biosynthesis C-methylase UbiE
MPDPAKFWNKMAQRYAKKPIEDQTAYEKKLEITRSYMNPDMEVLEIGCGTGSTALLHAPYVKHIRATDFSEGMLQIAREKAEKQGIENVTFDCVGIGELDVAENSQDMVLALSVLHLLENKEKAMADIYKMLKPGGLFVSSTVCIKDMGAIFKYILPAGYKLGVFPLVKVFDAQHLEQSITDAGFKIEHNWRPSEKKAVFIVARKEA